MLLAGGEEEEIILKYTRALFLSVSLSKTGETVLPEPNLLGFYRSLTQLPWWLRGEVSNCKAGDTGSILGLGRSSGERNGNPLKYSCLGSPKDRRAWRATVPGVTKEQDTT